MNTQFNLENASIWVDTAEGYYKLSDCTAKLNTIEDIQTCTLSGSSTEYQVVSYRTILAICSDVEAANVEFLKTVKRFDLKFTPVTVRQNNCTVDIPMLDGIKPLRLDLNGEWLFDVTDKIDAVKNLFPDLVFG